MALSIVYLFIMMTICIGIPWNALALDYCGGLKPVTGRWSQFAGKCYVQRINASQETASSPQSCKTFTIRPGTPSTQGHTIVTMTVAGQMSSVTYNWNEVAGTKAQMLDTLLGTWASLCTYRQNPREDKITLLMKMAEKQGFNMKDMVTVSQANCPHVP